MKKQRQAAEKSTEIELKPLGVGVTEQQQKLCRESKPQQQTQQKPLRDCKPQHQQQQTQDVVQEFQQEQRPHSDQGLQQQQKQHGVEGLHHIQDLQLWGRWVEHTGYKHS